MTKANILIVEDDRIVAEDLKMSLENLGYKVSGITASGEDALAMIEAHPPDLILMDIMLKGAMNGTETAGRVRSLFDIPVIYVTAYADEDVLTRAKSTEPFGYIVKPFEEIALNSAIEIAMYKHGMEARLRESEAWLFTVLNSIGDAVIATDKEGRIKFLNPLARSMTGWTDNTAIGRPLEEVFVIVNEETRAPVENPVRKVLLEGKRAELANHTSLIARDGTEIPIDDSGAPILDKEGRMIGVVLVFRDICRRRKTEKENSRLQEQLRQSQKMESISTLAGGIAHDFNNSLGIILGSVSYALSRIDQNHELYEVLMRVQEGTIQAQSLTQQLLTFAKGGAPIKKTLDLNPVIRKSADFSCRGGPCRCMLDLSESLWPVDVDEGQIHQVLTNLIINANQSMPHGGVILIKTENTEIGPKTAIPLPEGNYIKITVEDQGIGIPQQYLASIFDPFFTTKQKGSGLGLTTSYAIVKQHGGHIAVYSEPNQGSVFTIYLPASSKSVDSAVENTSGYHHGHGRVLIMDDQEPILEMLAEMLDMMGYETALARNGEETIRLYRDAVQSGNRFDLVVLDLTVPGGMGGVKTMAELLKIDPGVNAVVSSGYSNDPIMANCGDYGFRGCVSKPYTMEQLSVVLNKTCRTPMDPANQ